MTEPQIRDYLLGVIEPRELEPDEKNIPTKQGKHEPYWKVVQAIEDGEFIIELRHLDKICDDVLSGKLKPDTLDLLSFIIIGSDYFTYDSYSPEGEKIGTVLFEWSNPTINYPLTVENVRQWKNYILFGQRKMNSE